MRRFDWSDSGEVLQGFGGRPTKLRVPKTGLPFFDAMRLYGALDLYIGVREDVTIEDAGDKWTVCGRSRRHVLDGRAESAFAQVWKKRKPPASDFCRQLLVALEGDTLLPRQHPIPITKALAGTDSALQSGIRDTAAAEYITMQTGQTGESTCCVAKIPLAEGVLAFAGKKRTESVGSIVFLPVFQGKVDLSKVVSPLRVWVNLPNVLCCQAMALLALKNSLFAEGYQNRLTAVVFNTELPGQRSDNYSGLVAINSTAVGRIGSADFVAHLYQVFRRLIGRAWGMRGEIYQPDALAMARWLMQPVPKHLSAMIGSQERLHRAGSGHALARAEYVREVFKMTYGDWTGDHETVKGFARAVASAIYHARMKEEKALEDRQKVWYDEVTMLRSASSAKAFIERAMILLEQGHREHSLVGTAHRNEAFDPQALFASIGKDRVSFETFRDLFRMYLVQESTYQEREKVTGNVVQEVLAGEPDTQSETEDEE